MYFSIGIYSFPMDPMDSIERTFHPLIQHEWDFSKSLTNRNWTFPSESIRVQWIRWTPSERLSTPFIQHERNFSKSLTNRKWTFPSESIRFQWIRWTPSERLSTPSSNMSGIFLSLSRIENELFHRNLFVSNGSNTLGRTLHHYTSGFPMGRKRIRLDSSRQYWTTLPDRNTVPLALRSEHDLYKFGLSLKRPFRSKPNWASSTFAVLSCSIFCL